MPELRASLSSEDVLGFHKTLSNWGRFGADDQLGTLNLIDATKRVAAARLVQRGVALGSVRRADH